MHLLISDRVLLAGTHKLWVRGKRTAGHAAWGSVVSDRHRQRLRSLLQGSYVL